MNYLIKSTFEHFMDNYQNEIIIILNKLNNIRKVFK